MTLAVVQCMGNFPDDMEYGLINLADLIDHRLKNIGATLIPTLYIHTYTKFDTIKEPRPFS